MLDVLLQSWLLLTLACLGLLVAVMSAQKAAAVVRTASRRLRSTPRAASAHAAVAAYAAVDARG